MANPEEPEETDLFDEYRKSLEGTQGMDEWKARRSASYEAQMVKKVLGHFDIRLSSARLREQCAEWGESGSPTFAWFANEYPSFPLYLGATFIPYVHETTLEQLYKSFLKTKVYQAYDAFLAGVPDDYAGVNVGLIFAWGGVGDLVLHGLVDLEVKGLRLAWRVGGRTLCLDRLVDKPNRAGLLFALNDRWSPD